jgi:hypothetical protein
MNDLNRIPESELGQGSGIKLAVCETEFDLYWQVALEVFDLIHENNKIGRPTLMIVPYGPVGPYSLLVWLVNHIMNHERGQVCFNTPRLFAVA